MAGCHEDWQFTALLDQVDSLMNTHPDSALALLQTKTDTIGHLPESQRMRYSLLTAKAQNKAYVKMCNIAYFYHFPPRHSYSFSGEVGVT